MLAFYLEKINEHSGISYVINEHIGELLLYIATNVLKI